MLLKIRVRYLGSVEASLDDTIRVSAEEFSIGRSVTSDLCLPDQQRLISSSHAAIKKRGDGYYVEDLSRNGMMSNGSPMAQNEEVYLRDGDELRIQDYSLEISIEADLPIADDLLDLASSDANVEPDDPFAIFSEDAKTGGETGKAAGDPLDAETDASPRRSRLDDLGLVSENIEPARIQPKELDKPSGDVPEWAQGIVEPGGSDADDPFGLKSPEPAVDEFPNPSQSEHPAQPAAEHSGAQAPVSTPLAGGDAEAAISALLEGLGLPGNLTRDPATLRSIGETLHLLAGGSVEMLRNRSDFKNAMRLSRTMVQAQDNNPFKLAANAEDLVDLLFVHPRRGYLGPGEATRETVMDLVFHELAVLEAVQAVSRELLKRIEPERLKELFERQGFSGGLSVLQKSKYWDAFEEYYQTQFLDRDPLMEAFANVYDETLKELQRRGK